MYCNTQRNTAWRKFNFDLLGNATMHRRRVLVRSNVERDGKIVVLQSLALRVIRDDDNSTCVLLEPSAVGFRVRR